MTSDLYPLRGRSARWWAAAGADEPPPTSRSQPNRGAVGRQRVCDHDRQQAADKLAYAHAIGMLTVDEYEQRIRAAWDAVTCDDLEPLTSDLARADNHDCDATSAEAADDAREALRTATIIWTCTSAFSLTVWLLLSVLGHRIAYPGFAWVVAPAGSVLAVLWPIYRRR